MSVWRTNRFWSVSLEHTLFFDFLKHFVNMCLAVSFAGKKKMHFFDLWIKSYGCLKFQGEAWAGWACAAANEKELTNCAKSGWQEEKKFPEKMDTARQVDVSTRGRPATSGRCPWVDGLGPAGDQRSPAGRESTPQPVELYLVF
jgi:hypothetical protein